VAALVASGMPAGPATAAVLVYRSISYWLPVLSGGVVLLVQRRRPEEPAVSAPVYGQ
jgi:uncharacterized membrane protein YbhN (UPF0104 family)